MLLRTEIGIDAAGIDRLLRQAASPQLAASIRGLREQGLLTLGVVATDDEGQVLGYGAFSPVGVDEEERGWTVVDVLVVADEYRETPLAKDLLFEGLDSLNEFSYSAVIAYQQLDWFQQQGFRAAPQLYIDSDPSLAVLVYPLEDQHAAETQAALTLPRITEITNL